MASEHTLRIKKRDGIYIFRLRQSGRTFAVLEAKVEGREDLSVGFRPSAGVTVLDETSDVRQVFNIAMKVEVDGVRLGYDEMRAPDIETLKLVLEKVKLAAFNLEEI